MLIVSSTLNFEAGYSQICSDSSIASRLTKMIATLGVIMRDYQDKGDSRKIG